MPKSIVSKQSHGPGGDKIIINSICNYPDPPSDLSECKSVPPSTPHGYIDVYNLSPLPLPFPQLGKLKIPYIREVGILTTIDLLADFFQCRDYKVNLIQFWFLDILSDCLWRSQDEFQFPEEHQKVILAWILYVFDLIRNPKLNLSRKRLFQIFNEAIRIAEIHIESAECALVSLPENLFTLHLDGDGDGIDKDARFDGDGDKSSLSAVNSQLSISSSDSSVTLPESTRNSVVAVKVKDTMDFFQLPVKPCPWDDDCLTSSVETLSEKSLNPTDSQIFIAPSRSPLPKAKELQPEDDDALFDEANKSGESIPSRFESDIKEIQEEDVVDSLDISIDSLESTNLNLLANDTYQWKIKTPTPPAECPSKVFTLSTDTIYESSMKTSQIRNKKLKHSKMSISRKKSTSRRSLRKSSIVKEESKSNSTKIGLSEADSKTANITKVKAIAKNQPQKDKISNISLKSGIFEEMSEFNKEDDMLKSWFHYHLWEKHLEDMANPNRGWYPTSEEYLKENEPIDSEQPSKDHSEAQEEWRKYLKDQKGIMDQLQENIFINSCVLMAIKQFVFDYFYESFNYKIIKTALRYPHSILAEKINDNWFVPKVIIDELQKPKPPKPKKEKPSKKEKKSKLDKKSKKKSDKQSKKTDKSSKKSDKKSKKLDKKSKKLDKKSKKSSEPKKEKKKKLTAEEKAELKRLAEEAKKLEEEQMRAEQNRRFMFPLADAADSEFFKSIFTSWDNDNDKKDTTKHPQSV